MLGRLAAAARAAAGRLVSAAARSSAATAVASAPRRTAAAAVSSSAPATVLVGADHGRGAMPDRPLGLALERLRERGMARLTATRAPRRG